MHVMIGDCDNASHMQVRFVLGLLVCCWRVGAVVLRVCGAAIKISFIGVYPWQKVNPELFLALYPSHLHQFVIIGKIFHPLKLARTRWA